MKELDLHNLNPLQDQYMHLGRIMRMRQSTVGFIQHRVNFYADKYQREGASEQEKAEFSKDLNGAKKELNEAKEDLASVTDQRRLVEIELENGRKS